MIKSTVKSILRRFGLDVRRMRSMPDLHLFLRSWRKSGFEPAFIIDVGANRGEWTRVTSSYFPHAQFLMIEPQERLKLFSRDLLVRSNIRWKTAGLSDQAGRMVLSVPGRDDSATFLTPSTGTNIGEHFEVEVTTLDAIAAQERRFPDLVKIDAEGLDLRVLRGASTLFGKTSVFLVECAICENGWENTLPAVCARFDGVGYRLAEFTDFYRARESGALLLCEAAFVPRNCSIAPA